MSVKFCWHGDEREVSYEQIGVLAEAYGWIPKRHADPDVWCHNDENLRCLRPCQRKWTGYKNCLARLEWADGHWEHPRQLDFLSDKIWTGETTKKGEIKWKGFKTFCCEEMAKVQLMSNYGNTRIWRVKLYRKPRKKRGFSGFCLT